MEQYTVAIGQLVVVITEDEDGGYLVTCPFDPELVTQGRTLDEAVAMAKVAKKTLDEARAKKTAVKPRARRAAGRPTVRVRKGGSSSGVFAAKNEDQLLAAVVQQRLVSKEKIVPFEEIEARLDCN